jgi:hypothetical protein
MSSNRSVESDIDYFDRYVWSNIEDLDSSDDEDTNIVKNKIKIRENDKEHNKENINRNEFDDEWDINIPKEVDTITQPPDLVVSEKVLEICHLVGIPHYFKAREETVYQIRITQCKASRKFTVKRNEKAGFHILCVCYPKCNFNILVRNTKQHGELVTDGDGKHTCMVTEHTNEHAGKKSPASSSIFLARFLKELIRNNITSGTALREYVYNQLNWYVPKSTIHKSISVCYKKYVFDDDIAFGLIEAYVQIIKDKGGILH